MEFSRVDRLQSQITKEVSIIVSNELRDQPPAMITFTRSEISRDLKYAKIFFSAYGKEEEISACVTFLKRHAGVIRRLIGQKIRMRFTPEISFHYDSSTDNVLRINEILNQIKRDEKKS